MSDEELWELEQQEAEANASQHKSVLDKYDEVTSKIDDIKDTVQEIKNKSKAGTSAGDVASGAGDVASTAGNVASSAGDVASSAGNVVSGAGDVASNVGNAASNVASGASKVSEATARAQKAAATAAEKGAQASKVAAQGGKAASKGVQAGGKGIQAAGKGMQAAGSSPYTAALKAAGAGVEGAGRGVEAGGKAGEAVATGAEAAASTAEAAAKAQKSAADAQIAAAKGAQAAKAASQAPKNVKKAADKTLSDKLRDSSKLNKIGNRIKDNKTKKFNPKNALNDFFDGFGEAGSALKKIVSLFNPVTIIVLFLLFIIIGVMILYSVVSPMYIMEQIKNPADTTEKLDNFFSGLGFNDSKEAFEKELEYLDKHYDNNLDYSYIMAALYYTDVFATNDEFYKESDNTGFAIAKYFIKESSSTKDENGLTFSANKIYRLRLLAKSQFLGDKQVASLPLADYINLCIEKMDNESKNLIKYFPFVLGSAIFGPAFDTIIEQNTSKKVIKDVIGVFQGTENWNSIRTYIENGKYDSGLKVAIENFVSTFLGCFFNIESISLNINIVTLVKSVVDPTSLANAITVNYYEYAFDMDVYEDYLVDHYIREMPEFQAMIKDEDGNINEDAVLKVAYEIKMSRDYYNDMFKKKSAKSDENTCVGEINQDILNELALPVKLTDGQKITFSGTNNYGFYKGKVHNGVDLEASSTATKQGDEVYSIYDGKVTESTVDDTFKEKGVRGGWVVIEYTVRFNDSSMGESKLGKAFKTNYSTFQVYYGGLDPNSLTLKQGNTVKKGQVIGKVGAVAASENASIPSVHFAIYDIYLGKYLNPINMFITCNKPTTTKACGTTRAQKIWTFLLSKGYTKEAAAGIMGVWKRESGLKPFVVQGWGGNDTKSKNYTKKVDNGTISKNKFAKKGPNGNGYGLAQWTTPSRKKALYNYAKKKGTSIGDLQTQLEFFEKEINSGSYKNMKIKQKMNKATSVEKTTKIFLRDYEGGGSSSLELRTKYAKEIYNKYKDYSCKQ